MRLSDFAYYRPKTVSEACALIGTLGEGTSFLAGGTEILPDFRRGRDSARHLISLQAIPDLGGIDHDGKVLRIGAMTRIEEIAGSQTVLRAFPVLAEAAAVIGGVQIRHQATIGGNFCRAVPCADTPPPCIVGSAQLRLAGPGGERTLAAEDFFTGPRQTVLHRDELLIEIRIPEQPANSGASYQRFTLRRGAGLAVASVAARLVLGGDIITDARVAMGAVAPVPLPAANCCLALIGQKAASGTFAAAAEKAAAEAEPITDLRGSADFRRELVRVLTLRALEEAASRARGGNRRGGR